jgi:hypothetical protein
MQEVGTGKARTEQCIAEFQGRAAGMELGGGAAVGATPQAVIADVADYLRQNNAELVTHSDVPRKAGQRTRMAAYDKGADVAGVRCRVRASK